MERIEYRGERGVVTILLTSVFTQPERDDERHSPTEFCAMIGFTLVVGFFCDSPETQESIRAQNHHGHKAQ